MISRPDIRTFWLLVAATSLLLSGCGSSEPSDPPMQVAQAALEKGDGFGAELALRELLDTGVPNKELAAMFGQAELLQDQLIEARKWLGDGQFSPSTAGRGFHMLGLLEMREGNLAAAGQAFDRAISLTPDNPRLWVDIGRLRYRGGEQGLAVDAAVNAVALGPHDSEALMFRGQLARDSQGMAEALGWFERAMAVNPDRLDLLAEYAATLGEAGKAQDMLAAVRRMSAINPGYSRSYFLQAALAARAGEYPLARRLLVRSRKVVDQSPASALLSGIIDLETGNYASAAQGFDRLFRQQPENRRVRDLLARSLALSGSHRELVHRFGAAAGMTNASPYLQTVVARSHEALGNRVAAAQLLDNAAQRQSGNLVALRPQSGLEALIPSNDLSGADTMALVRNRIVTRSAGQASTAADAFLRRFPGSADALALAGDAQLANRNAAMALRHYERSARIRQSWPLARRRYAALQMLGRAGEARSLLESFVRGHTSSVEPLVILAREYYRIGNLPRAAKLTDHALTAGADRDPEVLALRSAIALRMDDPEKAQAFASRAYLVQPVSPAALQALAMSGSKAVSRAALAKADRLTRKAMLARR